MKTENTHILGHKKYSTFNYLFDTIEDVKRMGFSKREVKAKLDKVPTNEDEWVFWTIDEETFQNYVDNLDNNRMIYVKKQ